MQSILVLGIGNILQSDDGLGVYIVNHIIESGIELPDNIELVDGGTAGFDLIPLMMGYDKIIIVDAVKTDDSPGSVYRFTPENARETKACFSIHEIGIMEVLRTMRIMGENPEIEFIGVVPEDIDTLNICISQSVKESIPRAVEAILDAARN